MAFKTWHTGVHIQQDKVLAVALVREKSGWGLRRWWQLSLAAGIIRDGQILQPEQLAAALREWRQLLPHQHQIFLAFPAAHASTPFHDPARQRTDRLDRRGDEP